MSIPKKNKDLSFGTSPDNIHGLKLQLEYNEETQICYGEIQVPEHFQGHNKNLIHPGIASILLEEAMTYINMSMNLYTELIEITVRYLKNIHISSPLYVRGYFVKKNRKSIEHRAEIENDLGKIVCRAKGKYLEINLLDEDSEERDSKDNTNNTAFEKNS